MELTAAGVVTDLRAHADEAELPRVRKRLAPDEPAIGMRMRDLFAVAKAATGLPLPEVERLLDEETYEARMAAMCILDFKARTALGSEELCDVYLRRHDRITTWDMVDRAAPRVVGGRVAGGPYDVLHTLAASEEPLRRRSAITAPLFLVRSGSDDDLAEGFEVAAALCPDPEPVVVHAVAIFLKYAGERDRLRLAVFLDRYADTLPRAALRLAVEKLPEPERRRHLG